MIAGAGDARLRNAVDELADQLCVAVDGNFDFAVRASVADEQLEKLSMLVNFVLDTARRGMLALEERNAKLAEIDRAKSDFLANVSHEFRTPLTLLLGPLEEAIQDPGLAPAARERLTTAQRNAQRLAKLVNTLLDFSRVEAGRATASFEPTDLATVTGELASLFRSAIEKANLRLVLDLPQLSEPAYVDREMWEKIVLNLLSNALKFTFEGEIGVALREVDSHFELVVRDTGIGMPEDELPRVFDRFHRIKAARARTHEGTGIGLALVQELVKLHGGQIRVASILGKGTTFTIVLPKGAAHLPQGQLSAARSEERTGLAAAILDEASRWRSPESEHGAAKTTASSGRARILVADDNADMRDYVARLLSEAWDVDVVADGAAALEAIELSPPDLVLADVMMPRLSGFELVRRLRANAETRHIPVVLLTARAGAESTADGLLSGANDYLVKPFAARDLLVRVEAQLALLRTRREHESELRGALDRSEQARLRAKHTEDLLRFFVEAGKVLSESLDVGETLTRLARLCVPRLADWASVDMLGADGRIERVAVEHIDPTRVQLARDLWQRSPAQLEDAHGVGLVLRTGRSELIPVIDDALLREAIADPAVLADVRALGLRSSMCVPLFDRGEPVGAISFVASDSQRTFSDDDLRVAEELARRASMAVEHARLYTEARTASRLKDEFLATVSHELRTPLNAILGWARLLRGGAPQAKVERALETIERNALAQVQLIEDLLDVSRIVSGKLRLDVQPFDLPQVVEAAIDSVRPALEAKGVRLLPTIDPRAGPIAGDPQRVQQVVWNLLTNAIKFTPKGGRIQLVLERIDSHVELTVSDTGQGIAKEILPFVFDRFRQADGSTTRVHGGLGLGLAISRHIVEAHGGTIHVSSEGAGRGAAFVVKLPLSTLRSEAKGPLLPRRAMREIPALEYPKELQGLTVLVIDDEPGTREVLTELLQRCGSTVLTAGSAEEGFAILESASPRVILCDIGMPSLDGYAFIRTLRARPIDKGGRVPAAALTAYASTEDRRRALRAGFQMHIAKPVEPAELVAVIANLAQLSVAMA